MTDLLDSDIVVTVGCDAVHSDQRGGQHVTRSCTGVRLTHTPTGVTVLVDSECSQHANKAEALRQLRAAILGASIASRHAHPLKRVHAYAWHCEECGSSWSLGYDPDGHEAREQRRLDAMLAVVEAAKAWRVTVVETVNCKPWLGEGDGSLRRIVDAVDVLDALEAL